MRESNFHFPAQNKACVCITSALYDRRAIDSTAPLPLISTLTHLSLLTSTHPPIREILCADGGLERLIHILRDVGKKMREQRDVLRREAKELAAGAAGGASYAASTSAGSGSGLSTKGWGWGGESNSGGGEKRKKRHGKEKEWDPPTSAAHELRLEETKPADPAPAPTCPFKPFTLHRRPLPPPSLAAAAPAPTVDGVAEVGPVTSGVGLTKEQKHTLWTWSLAFQCVVNIGVRGSEGVRTKVVEAGVVPLVIGVLGGFLHEADRKRHQSEMLERDLRKLRAATQNALFQQQSQPPHLQRTSLAVSSGRSHVAGGQSGASSQVSSFSSIASNDTTSTASSSSSSGRSTAPTSAASSSIMAAAFAPLRRRSHRAASTATVDEDEEIGSSGASLPRLDVPMDPVHRSVSPAYSTADSVTSSNGLNSAGPQTPSRTPTFASIWPGSFAPSSSGPRGGEDRGAERAWSARQAAAGYGIPRLSTPDAIPSSASRDLDGETNDGSGGSGSGDGDDDEVMELDDDEGSEAGLSRRRRRGTIKAIPKMAGAGRRVDDEGDLDMDEGPEEDDPAAAVSARTPRAALARLGSFARSRSTAVDAVAAVSGDAEMDVDDEDERASMAATPTILAPRSTRMGSNRSARGPSQPDVPPRASSERRRDRATDQPGLGGASEELAQAQLAQAQQVADAVAPAPQIAQAAVAAATVPSAASLLTYREEDVLLALQLLAYLSKYPHVRDVFHAPADKPTLELTYGTSAEAARAVASFAGKVKAERGERERAKERHRLAKEGKKNGGMDGCFLSLKCRDRASSRSSKDTSSAASTLSTVTAATNASASSASSHVQLVNPLSTNVFSFVERFTVQANPADRHAVSLPKPIRYWAGVVMRNACRKDDVRGGIRRCANMQCGQWESFPREFAKCRRCRKAKYCSKTCQSKAWQLGHRFWCTVKGNSDGDEAGEVGEDDAEAADGAPANSHGHRSRSSRSRAARAAAAAAAQRPTPSGTDREDEEDEELDEGATVRGAGGRASVGAGGVGGGRSDGTGADPRDRDPLQSLGERNAELVQAAAAVQMPEDESDIARQMMESELADFGTAVFQDFNRPGLPTLTETPF